MPSLYARELLMANQVKFLGWYSELDEQQLGALFVSKKMLETRTRRRRKIRARLSSWRRRLCCRVIA